MKKKINWKKKVLIALAIFVVVGNITFFAGKAHYDRGISYMRYGQWVNVPKSMDDVYRKTFIVSLAISLASLGINFFEYDTYRCLKCGGEFLLSKNDSKKCKFCDNIDDKNYGGF